MIPLTTQSLGYQTEALALRYLIAQGLKKVETNYRAFCGEIDLIMQDRDDTLIFVEVRYRKTLDEAIESIRPYKIHKLIRTAEYYLLCQPGGHTPPCRFDVIAIDHGHRLEWIQNAIEQR